MSELILNEGQEFHTGGKRFVIRGRVPVQEEKRGPLGGELVRSEDVLDYQPAYIALRKRGDEYDSEHDYYDVFDQDQCLQVPKGHFVEINLPPRHADTPQQAKGRVMTAGEAARLPDIVGKRVAVFGSVVRSVIDNEPLKVQFTRRDDYRWLSASNKIEVLD